jgi:UDP-3-O-[3-hydroxymyristoyl] glucosamine N-acyltransferase
VRKLLHVGRVVIGDRVEIGANSTIERATFQGDATILCDDVKLDPLVHIGHNVTIGARSCIAQSGIGGSTNIGEDAWIGTGVTISNGLSIGNRVKVLLNAVVAYDVKDDEIVSGFYAMPHKQWKRVWMRLKEEL